MHVNSTELLKLIAENNCYIWFDASAPRRDFIPVKTQDGRDFKFRTPQGYYAVELPRETFSDFIAASLIKQDGPEDFAGRIVFRLTPDGYARAAA